MSLTGCLGIGWRIGLAGIAGCADLADDDLLRGYCSFLGTCSIDSGGERQTSGMISGEPIGSESWPGIVQSRGADIWDR